MIQATKAPIHPHSMTRMGAPRAVHQEEAGTKYLTAPNAVGVSAMIAIEIVAVIAPTGRRLNARPTTSRRVLP